MTKAISTVIAPARGRGGVTRISTARSAVNRRQEEINKARSARRELRRRSDRFAHLKQMHD